MVNDKLFASSADQNKAFILEALQTLIQENDQILEIGSGTGQHACHFAKALSKHHAGVSWQPTELRKMIPVIRQWMADEGSDNIKPPMELDVIEADWPVTSADVVYTANTLHIMSAPAVEATFAGIEKVLSEGGRFCAYGPFIFSGEHTSESNAQFDKTLKGNDPRSGIRDMDWLNTLAEQRGLKPAELITMPVNNFLAVWRRAPLN